MTITSSLKVKPFECDKSKSVQVRLDGQSSLKYTSGEMQTRINYSIRRSGICWKFSKNQLDSSGRRTYVS